MMIKSRVGDWGLGDWNLGIENIGFELGIGIGNWDGRLGLAIRIGD